MARVSVREPYAPGRPPAPSACLLGVCDGSTWLIDEETDEARPCECRERRIAASRTRSVAHTVPKRFRGMSFDRHPIVDLPEDVRREARAFCRKLPEKLAAGEGMGFWGPRGTGKTSLAMLVASEAIARSFTVGIYSLPRLLNDIRATYDDRSEQRYGELMAALTGVDLLQIDDLAVVDANAWVLEQLYTVVNTRYEDGRSILFTADLPLWSDLGRHIGERTWSRLYETCGPPLPMFGEDHRERRALELAERRGMTS